MTYGGKLFKRFILIAFVMIAIAVAAGSLIAIESNVESYKSVSRIPAQTAEPFPIGVDPKQATITEQIFIDEFYGDQLAQRDKDNSSWWNQVASQLQTKYLWQQLASPVSRIIVVWSGERTEEVAGNIGTVLRWDQEERQTFITLMQENDLDFSQGMIVPGRYITHRYATPEDVAASLQETYNKDISQRYTTDIEEILPLSETLIIASLIEREASDFENMREVSGVIWNRLFIDMALQLDASLQYVKAEDPHEPAWWPAVRPADKFIDSPYNTYQNKGLPPAPIANPSIEAIVAALNPRVTDCLYYFHSSTREYYCSETYEEHVTKLRQVYGQGR